jgi:predicted RNase H-like nuclease
MAARVLGVDGCKLGWVGVTWEGEAYFGTSITELLTAAGPVACVGIDVPIGLPDAGRRQADSLARQLVGRRASSVFTIPVRVALEAPSHADAIAVNRAVTGEGLSAQVFALASKILEVDAFVRTTSTPVIEVHPELSFATLAGSPLPWGKKTWAGMQHRRELLAAAGLRLSSDLGEVGHRAAVDDVLDAAAVAWTSVRFAQGQAISLPDPPEVFSDSISCAIWA